MKTMHGVLLLGCLCMQVVGQYTVSQCPISWTRDDGCCYYISDDSLNFYAAASFCQVLGGRLMQVYNRRKEDFIAQEMKNAKVDNAWIGGRSNNHKSWEWIPSFQPFVYTNWNEGEPNFPDTEKCVHINAGRDKKWFNEMCTHAYRFICERCPTITTVG